MPTVCWVSLVAQLLKNLPASEGDMGSVPGLGRAPGEGNGNPLQNPWHGKSHGQNNLTGYSLWSQERVNMTE